MLAGVPAAPKLDWSRCLSISQAFPAVPHGVCCGSRVKQQRKRFLNGRVRARRVHALLTSTLSWT